jgi:hypothetical protein
MCILQFFLHYRILCLSILNFAVSFTNKFYWRRLDSDKQNFKLK